MTELEQHLVAENAALRQQVADMTAQLVRLTARVEELLAQLGRNSSNSSKPPSTDAPWNVKRRPPPAPSGRKRGGQPGHEGHKRVMLAPTDEFDVHATHCDGCGAALDASTILADEDWVHQLVELVSATKVTNYHRLLHQCGCGRKTRAPMPEGVPPTVTGPRLQAVISTLIARHGLSRADVQEALDQIFGIKLSVGAIHEVTERAGQATGPAVEDIGTQLQAAPAKHCDETGWRHGGKRAWLWTVTNAMGAFFRIDPERSRAAFRRLLPKLEGVIHTDRWRVYDIIEKELRQLCHAHLRRDIQALVDFGPTTDIGKALLAASDKLFHEWHRFVRGEIDRTALRLAMAPVQESWRDLLEQAGNHEHKKARNLGCDLHEQWASLWTFLDHDGVVPTNNRAEGTIRQPGLLRKTNGGTYSDAGAEFVGNLQSVIATAKCQNVRLVDWLQRVFEAWWSPVELPMLLPRASG